MYTTVYVLIIGFDHQEASIYASSRNEGCIRNDNSYLKKRMIETTRRQDLAIGSRYCSWSIRTVEEVDSCPLSKVEMEQRKQKKKCEALANLQNCTEPHNFLYHCVINDLENALVEVCAPAYVIIGYCAEFNIVGALVQQHFNLKCSDVKPKCAARYNSTDAYLYQGCYDVVKNKARAINASPTTTSSSINGNTSKQGGGLELSAVIGITVGGVLFCAIVLVIVLAILIHRSKRKEKEKRRNERQNDAELEMLLDTEEPGHIIALYDYYFVETNVSKECSEKLEKQRIVFLIGQQGSGKTATAFHVLRENKYKTWSRKTITSKEQLAVLEPEKETLVFIDNLLDRYEYCQIAKEWWDTIWEFYDKYISKKNNVLLIITVKDEVMKNALVFNDDEKQTLLKNWSVDANALSENEKKEILKSQFTLANRLKNTNFQYFDEHHQKLIIEETSTIGFPLCAHLYTFEIEETKRDSSIIRSPLSHVLKQIKQEMTSDKSGGVKTLFLLLMFYFSRTGSNSHKEFFCLNSKNECIDFLSQYNGISRKMLKEIGPLSFKNLHIKAKALEGKILVKSKNGYVFKHQIYLEGIRNYFFRHYFKYAFKYFPFDIIQYCELPDISPEKIQTLMERLIAELKEHHFFEVFSREIFRARQFENDFCELVSKMPFLEPLLGVCDSSTAFELPAIFWASKYNLQKLENLFLARAEKSEENFERQLYFAMFGECCAIDEMAMRGTMKMRGTMRGTMRGAPLDIKQIQELVLNFRTSEGQTILHILVSSEKSDYDAHRFLTKLLNESQETDFGLDGSVVVLALQQTKKSRLMCLIEMLNRLKGAHESTKLSDHDIDCLVNDYANDKFLELECLCRICILKVYGKYSFTENMAGFLKYKFPDNQKEISLEEKMKLSIERCLESLNVSSSMPETIIPPMPEIMETDWKNAIKKSIQILAKREETFHAKRDQNK